MQHTRQIYLDTETTGLNPAEGHRLIEIAAMEAINGELTGNNFHYYLNPGRDIDEGAAKVHGITTEFLQDKLEFSDISRRLFSFLFGSTLIIHNARFDLGFIFNEFRMAHNKMVGPPELRCPIIDTLPMARDLWPYPQKNNLDALCDRLQVDRTRRGLHGALVDCALLAEVYPKLINYRQQAA